MWVVCQSWKYQSYKKDNIEKNLTAADSHLSKISARDVEQLLRNIDGKKSTGIDKIPPKLIKENVLSQPLAIPNKNSFNKRIFQDNAKIAWVSPLDKHNDDNFRPVNILNTFSKTLEKIAKEFFISKIEHRFLRFISACQKSFSTEHVFVRLLEN